MPTLIAKNRNAQRRFSFEIGLNLLKILNDSDDAAFHIRVGCAGVGACGLCQVRVLRGDANEPSVVERLHLSDEQIDDGLRLACQTTPVGDICVEIIAPAPKNEWSRLTSIRPSTPSDSPKNATASRATSENFGIAVDVGTTRLRLSLIDLGDGRRLADRVGPNPQTTFGADVMTRLIAAAESDEKAQKMSTRVIDAIAAGLWDVAFRDRIDLRKAKRVSLVGNTAMLALLTGQNVDQLLSPRHWTSKIDCAPKSVDVWRRAWTVKPTAKIEVIPPLAGFVGSDLLAGVSITKLVESDPGAMLIDVGTNSEIALWDGDCLRVTAAAGGPAFEGVGIRCASPARPGAIHQVRSDGGTFSFKKISDAAPTGFCGSGLVDLIAELLKADIIDPKGNFTTSSTSDGYSVTCEDHRFTLAKRDLDMFQRAKAAIGVGVQVLLQRAGMTSNDLRDIHICGAFGGYLNIQNAQKIGLLPTAPMATVRLDGDAALAGCEKMLLGADDPSRTCSLEKPVEIVNLSQCEDFDELFLNHLFLRPMEL